MKIVLATENKGKIAELQEILLEFAVEVLTLADFPALTLPPEDADTFEGNALIKARHIAKETGLVALADDSGLCVEALKGAPGVHSARYAGDEATDEDNNNKLIEALKGLGQDKRGANFVCVLALVNPNNDERTFSGTLNGRISTECRGTDGFGYDPLFIPTELPGNYTLAVVGPEMKNRISHRARALGKLKEYTATLLNR